MSTRGLTRAQHPWIVEDERLSNQESPLQEQGSRSARKKIQKKSIRNAKDSAEMARIKIERRWGQNTNQAAHPSNAGKVGRHFGILRNGNNSSVNLSGEPDDLRSSKAADRLGPSAFQTSPLTPPQSSETQGPSGFYWHDGLHASAAALAQMPSQSGMLEAKASFDSAYLMPVGASSELHLPLFGAPGQDHHPVRWRSPSFDSARPTVHRKRRSSPQRPKTASGIDAALLEVPIPHYRLGTPQFSERGTAFLHNSLHTAFSSTLDLAAAPVSSQINVNNLFPASPSQRYLSHTPMRGSATSWFSPSVTPALEDPRPSPLVIPPAESSEIPPSVYDELSRDPDNPKYVMYAPGKRELIAATKARLMVEITSVNFLDYELLSDFFLTYRTYMTPADLARYLFARLRWAVSQGDATGRIVRVRTFVALRHWVLNYFMDDFEHDFELRHLFCHLVNRLSLDLQQRPGGGGGDLQVLNELKKCWKRTSAPVWDTEDASDFDASSHAFRPNDTASSDSGVSIPNLTPTRPGGAHAVIQDRGAISPGGHSYFEYSSPNTTNRTQVPESPFSDTSVHVTSCSIPMRKRSRPNFTSEKQPKDKAHPPLSQPLRTLQRRPSSRHQRSGSFSDALRDDRSPVPVTQLDVAESFEMSETCFRGELVRGTVIPPNSANIVLPGPLSPLQARYRSPDASSLLHPDAISNPAVLKLLGGVRRALSTRHPSKPSLTGGHKPSSSGDLRKLRAHQSLSRPAALEQSAKRDQPRSDALAALVARSWDEQPRGVSNHIESSGVDKEDRAPSAQSQLIPATERPLGPTRFNSHITTGSRSIVIVDDTGTTSSSLSRPPPPSDVRSIETVSDDADLISTIRDMAINNTAFMFPDLQYSSMQPYFVDLQGQTDRMRVTTPGTTSVMNGPLSPPPNIPLPPLPSKAGSNQNTRLTITDPCSPWSQPDAQPEAGGSPQSLATPLSQIGLALGMPFQQDQTPFHHDRPASKVSPAATESEAISEAESGQPRQLRRRPGGNLRAVNTVHDLDIGATRRRQSTGSLSSPGYSSGGSPVISPDFCSIDVVARWSKAFFGDRATEGHSRSATRKGSLRLLSTHSSQPNLRPSFEAEVKRLASLPADEDDAGDIEATLLKLEGRYQPSRYSAKTESMSLNGQDFPELQRYEMDGQAADYDSEIRKAEFMDDMLGPTTPNTETQGASIYNMSQASHETVMHIPESPSTPDRLLGHEGTRSPEAEKEIKKWRRSSRVLWSPELLPQSPSSPRSPYSRDRDVSLIEARDFARSPKSPRARFVYHTREPSEAASSSHTKSSFLLDDNESLVDNASVKVVEQAIAEEQEGVDQSFFLDEEEDESTSLRKASETFLGGPMQRPPTPPTTIGASSDIAPFSPSSSLLSPGPRPASGPKDLFSLPDRQSPERDLQKQLDFTPRKFRKGPPSRLHLPRHIPTHHTPFILAYSSTALAAQFTLIEKDALDCIDWKDLVNLSWSQACTSIRDWAQYTHLLSSPTNSISSVDLIIARFNLVIKWCISSVLLCATPEERAACITKFIHVATHAHVKFRNFATMAQIAIGLLSSDLTRLTKTWDLVPIAEKDTLKKLEVLVSPVRNFAALRAEMESAAATLDEDVVGEDKGVIPFVGVYTRDLMLNAQKPAFLVTEAEASESGGHEQLINFERYRTTATIVKGVLRLLDASSRYTIKPQREILSRCLWLAALGDAELASLSKGLE